MGTRGTASWAIGLILGCTLAVPGVAQTAGFIEHFAGGSNGDGGPGTSAALDPEGSAVDQAGNIYTADSKNNRVRRIDANTGVITTIAGSGEIGYSGDGGLATDATFDFPTDVEFDGSGNLFIADRGNHVIRRIDNASGVITTVAGTGNQGDHTGTVVATSGSMNNPNAIAIDEETGAIFVADSNNHRIRRFFVGGSMTTYAGRPGAPGFGGDGGPATGTNAKLSFPWDVALDPAGNLYIADFFNQRIRVVDVQQRIHTFAGTGSFGFADGPRQEAKFRSPSSVAYDPVEDAVLVADSGNVRLRRIPLDPSQDVSTLAGNGVSGFTEDGESAAQVVLNNPTGLAVDTTLGVIFADRGNARVRRINRSDTLETVAGNGNLPFAGDGGPSTASRLQSPSGAATDASGRVYIVDTQNHRIRRVATNGIISTIAGNGEPGFSGNNGLAINAQLETPSSVAIDDAGNLYISDSDNHRVRRVDANTGIITAFFGNGGTNSGGDGGSATQARVVRPGKLAVQEGPQGNFLYVSEPSSHKVRRVNLDTNIASTFAGTGTFGYNGEGPAASREFSAPNAIEIGPDNYVYICDSGNNRIRKVAPQSPHITQTVAGSGELGFSGDGGLAISAELSAPTDVAVDGNGSIYIADRGNLRIRVVTTDGTIQTATGTGIATGRLDGSGGNGENNPLDDLGDGGPATAASFTDPFTIAISDSGDAYIVDNGAETVRRIFNIESVYDMGAVTADVFGTVRHASTFLPVPGIVVRAVGPTTMQIPTDSAGDYEVLDIPSAPWLLEPTRTGGIGSGVIGALDASFILQQQVSLREFSTAQDLACDVTGDGDVSALDATRILQFAAGSLATFDAADNCNSDWLFIPTAQPNATQNNVQPLLQNGTTCRMGAIQFNPLTGQTDGQDFLGAVIGDCTGNWNSGAGAATSARGVNATVTVGPARARGGRIRLPISIAASGGFHAAEIRLGFDPRATVRRVHKRGEANRSMVVSASNQPGSLSIMVASGQTMAPRARAAIVVDFDAKDARAISRLIQSAQAQIDENDARVRVPRSRRQRR